MRPSTFPVFPEPFAESVGTLRAAPEAALRSLTSAINQGVSPDGKREKSVPGVRAALKRVVPGCWSSSERLRHPPVPAPLLLPGSLRGPGWRAEREKSGRRWLPSPSQQPALGPPPPPARLSQPIRGGGGWADRCFAFCPLSRVYFTLSRYSAIRNDHRLNCGSSSAATRSQNILAASRRSHVGSVFFPAVTKCWRKRLIQPVTRVRNLPAVRKDLPPATFLHGYNFESCKFKGI